ncbi:MAG: alpha/beta hydrolase [Nannocystaceae bacterium]
MINNDRTVIAADGTRVAYGIHGDGPPVVLVNGLTTSVYYWDHLFPAWSRRFTLITWDFKGHGRSEPARSPDGATIPALADDLRRILDDAGIDRAALIGFSMGAQVILEAYRAYPERITALVPLFGPYQRVLDTALGPLGRVIGAVVKRAPPALVHASARVAVQAGRLRLPYTIGQRLGLIGPDASYADVRRFLDHLRRIHPPTIRRMALAAQAHSAADVLPRIAVPTLVVTGDADPFAPAAKVGAPMQRLIPGAELLRMPHGTHTSLFEHYDELDAAITDFFARRGVAGAAPASVDERA